MDLLTAPFSSERLAAPCSAVRPFPSYPSHLHAAAPSQPPPFCNPFLSTAATAFRGTVSGTLSVTPCALCSAPAAVHCAADGAHLCVSCDQAVHVANPLVMKHVRTLLCSSCSRSTAVQFVGFLTAPLPFLSVCLTCRSAAPIAHPSAFHGCRPVRLVTADALPGHAAVDPAAADVSLARVASAPALGVYTAGVYPVQMGDVGRGCSFLRDQSQSDLSMRRIGSQQSGDSAGDGASPASGVTTECCEAVGGNSYDLQSVFHAHPQLLHTQQTQQQLQRQHHHHHQLQQQDRAILHSRPEIQSEPLNLFPQVPENVGLRGNGTLHASGETNDGAQEPSAKRRRTEIGVDGTAGCVDRSEVAEPKVTVNGEPIIGDGLSADHSSSDRKRTLFESQQSQPSPTRQPQAASTSDGPALGETAAARLKRVLQSWSTRLHLPESSAHALAFHMLQRILRKLRPTDVAADALRVVLATCLWVAIKSQECQDAVPRASQIAAVARVTAGAVVGMEIEVLKLLSWRPLEGFHVEGEK